ncbi:MAG: hypothetical protein H6767_02180 [Candidatus Peribacteria bacterium]|nr:MAG: hypothetical protein H6767_02180 [Candidatus Peribacteria bacterium]
MSSNTAVTIEKKQLQEYLELVDVINSERDILVGKYIKSDNYNELIQYLDK